MQSGAAALPALASSPLPPIGTDHGGADLADREPDDPLDCSRWRRRFAMAPSMPALLPRRLPALRNPPKLPTSTQPLLRPTEINYRVAAPCPPLATYRVADRCRGPPKAANPTQLPSWVQSKDAAILLPAPPTQPRPTLCRRPRQVLPRRSPLKAVHDIKLPPLVPSKEGPALRIPRCQRW